ncbi:hypothetical protein Fmac_011462 [Flemingia macrophylla]|uniref:NADH dehydrogenase subunit 4 n=1 Tax=Flemingia macrophylla TaxID=520843 RepID=A0ABD1MMI5_9FABA
MAWRPLLLLRLGQAFHPTTIHHLSYMLWFCLPSMNFLHIVTCLNIMLRATKHVLYVTRGL